MLGSKKMEFENFVIASIEASGDEKLVGAMFASYSERRIRSLVAELSVTARHDPELLAKYSPVEIVALTKSAARMEDMIGGVGSPTSIHVLLPLAKEHEARALDWVLQHTSAYSYYTSARSAKEYFSDRRVQEGQRIKRQAANFVRGIIEEQKRAETRRRKATQATDRLVPAIKRGDKKAVLALLRQGADRTRRSDEGLLPDQVAEQLGHSEIAELISTFED